VAKQKQNRYPEYWFSDLVASVWDELPPSEITLFKREMMIRVLKGEFDDHAPAFRAVIEDKDRGLVAVPEAEPLDRYQARINFERGYKQVELDLEGEKGGAE